MMRCRAIRDIPLPSPGLDPGQASAGPAAKDARGQKEDGLYGLEHGVDSDTEDAEWEEEQPQQRVDDECEERHRPGQDKDEQPEQERDHGIKGSAG